MLQLGKRFLTNTLGKVYSSRDNHRVEHAQCSSPLLVFVYAKLLWDFLPAAFPQ